MSYKKVLDKKKAEADAEVVQMIKDGYSNEEIRKKIRAVHGAYFDDLKINYRRRKVAKNEI